MALSDELSIAQARRVTLAAQGFTDPAPGGAVTMRVLAFLLRRLGTAVVLLVVLSFIVFSNHC